MEHHRISSSFVLEGEMVNYVEAAERETNASVLDF